MFKLTCFVIRTFSLCMCVFHYYYFCVYTIHFPPNLGALNTIYYTSGFSGSWICIGHCRHVYVCLWCRKTQSLDAGIVFRLVLSYVCQLMLTKGWWRLSCLPGPLSVISLKGVEFLHLVLINCHLILCVLFSFFPLFFFLFLCLPFFFCFNYIILERLPLTIWKFLVLFFVFMEVTLNFFSHT